MRAPGLSLLLFLKHRVYFYLAYPRCCQRETESTNPVFSSLPSFCPPPTSLVTRFISVVIWKSLWKSSHRHVLNPSFVRHCVVSGLSYSAGHATHSPVQVPKQTLAIPSVRILSLRACVRGIPEAPCFFLVLHWSTCLAYTFSNMLFESGTVQIPFIMMGISLKVLKPSLSFSPSVNINRSAPGPRSDPKPEDPGLKIHDQDPESRAALGIRTQDLGPRPKIQRP